MSEVKEIRIGAGGGYLPCGCEICGYLSDGHNANGRTVAGNKFVCDDCVKEHTGLYDNLVEARLQNDIELKAELEAAQ